MNIKELTINVDDIEITNNSEIENEGKIYGKRYISVDGKTFPTKMKTADSVDNISTKESDIRIESINDTVYSESIYFLFI
jgi:hypothetical protein